MQDIFNSFKFPISNKTYKIKRELDSLLPARYFKYGTINFINFFKKDKSFNDYMIKLSQFEDVLIDLNCKKMINELNKYKKNQKELSLRSFLAQYNKDCISKDELNSLFNYYMNQFKKFIFTYDKFISSFYDDQINILKEKLKPYNVNNIYLLYNDNIDNPYPITYFSRSNIIMSVLYEYMPHSECFKILKNLKNIKCKYPFISLFQMMNDTIKSMAYMSIYRHKNLKLSYELNDDTQRVHQFISNISKNDMFKIVAQLYTNSTDSKIDQIIYPMCYMQLPMIPSIIPLIGFEYDNHIYKISMNINSMYNAPRYTSTTKLKKENINIFEYNFDNINTITCFNENTVNDILHDGLNDLFDDLKKNSHYKKCAAQNYDDRLKYSSNKTKAIFNTLNLKLYNIKSSDLYYIIQNGISNDCDEFQSKLYQLLYYLVWDSIIFDDNVYKSICKSIKHYIFKYGKIMKKINSFCAKHNYKPNIHIKYDDSKHTYYTFKIRHIFNESQVDQLFDPNINLCYDSKKINVSIDVILYPADNSKTIILDKLFSDLSNDPILYDIMDNSYHFYKYNKKDIKRLREIILKCCYTYYPKNVIIKIVNALYDKYTQNMCDIMKRLSNNNHSDNFEDFFTQFKYYLGNDLSKGIIKYKKV